MITIKNIKFTTLLLVVAVVFAAFYFTQDRRKSYTRTIYDALDTVCTITVNSERENPLDEYTDIIYRYDETLSHTDENSEIYKLNEGAMQTTSPDTATLLDIAAEFSLDNPTLFDITLEPVVSLWTRAEETGILPSDEELASALSEKGADKIKTSENTADLGGSRVILGAAAKGYILDKLAEYMRAAGEDSALINLGGSTYSIGKKPDNSSWCVAIADPNQKSDYICTLTTENTSVVTSGDYLRFFELDGVKYHHIIDPETARPADSGLSSVTIVTENATLADMLSTACYVAGLNDGLLLCEKYGVEAVFVTEDTVHYTNGLNAIIGDKSELYTFIEH